MGFFVALDEEDDSDGSDPDDSDEEEREEWEERGISNASGKSNRIKATTSSFKVPMGRLFIKAVPACNANCK